MERTIGDKLSLLMENLEDSTFLIVIDNEMIASLPSLKTGKESWIQAANSLLNQMMGLQMKISKLQMQYRVWTGDDSECYYHAVLFIAFSKEMMQKQKRHSESGGMKYNWKSVGEITRMELVSPEIAAYFPIPGQDYEKRMKIFDSCALYMDSFVEVLKEHVMVGPSVKEVFEQLVVDSWNPAEQMSLIREYQQACHPFVLMGYSIFRKFVSSAGITDDLASNLFRTADITMRGALNCKEFLCIIAFLEPVERTLMSCIEAEARYIFRYFNKRKNGIWTPGELEAFLVEIRKKYKATPVLDKDIAKFYRDSDLSPGTDVTLLQFVKSVTSAKFRIPPGFLKNNSNMTQTFLQGSQASKVKSIERSPTISPASDRTVSKRDQKGQAEIAFSMPSGDTRYTFAYHVIKLSKGGPPETATMDNYATCMSNIEINQTFIGREQSKANFSYDTPFNEVIMGLRYFANSSAPNGKSKTPFSWEKVEFNHLGELLIRLSNQVIEVFKREPRLLRVSAPVYILGDIHGNFVDLWLFENAIWPSGLELLTGGVLMLGDYVDRGPHGVEVIAYLFAQKMKNPKRLHMVRGNHEIRHVQKQFTFFNECQKKFGKDLGQDVWKAVNNAFDYLPLAAVVDDVIFGCHGGVPPPWLCPNISVIDSIPAPLPNPDSQSPLAWELLWNDPLRDAWLNDAIRTELSLNDGFAVNKRRGTAHMFSAQALEKFHKVNKLIFTVRAHEVVDCGFKLMQNGKLATIFSTSYYSGMTNRAACMMVQDGKIRLINLVTDEYHKAEGGRKDSAIK